MLHNNLSSIRKQVTAFNFLNQDASCLLKLVSLTRKSLQFSHVGVCCWLTSETNGPNIQMWLSRVVTSSSLSPGQLCNVCARYLKREKRPSESDDIDSESGGRCRLLMMYEVKRSVHQRAGRLLLHPETPRALSPPVSPPRVRIHHPLSALASSTHHTGYLQTHFTMLSCWMFIDPSFFSPSLSSTFIKALRLVVPL